MHYDTNDNQQEVDILESKIKQKNRRIKILTIINIILIVLLFLIYVLVYRVGQIGIPVSTRDIDTIEVSDANNKWTEIGKINIFNNLKFENNKMIAPNSSGIYDFAVKNITENNIEYNIAFQAESDYKVNMQYKLKLNNIYIAGNEEAWVTLEELERKAIRLAENSTNLFTLEWKWIDNDEIDTFIGMQENVEYTLKITINASAIGNTKEIENEI